MSKKIEYVFFDLDGTVLTSKTKEILPSTIDAVKILKQNGIKYGLATGRHYITLAREFECLEPNLPLICMNGSFIMDLKGNVIAEYLLDNNIAYEIAKLLVNNKIDFFVYCKDMIYCSDLNSKYNRYLNQLLESYPAKWKWEIALLQDLQLLKTKSIYKFLIYFNNEQEPFILKLKQQYSQLGIEKSQYNLYDIFPLNVSKGDGLKLLQEKHYIDPSKTLIFGDNENDISIFKVCQYSVAMGNAIERLKNIATWITDTNDADGIYKFIKNYQWS